MARLAAFLGVTVALLAAAAAFDWWVDPFGQVWKPDVLRVARAKDCLVSGELIGSRYWTFKRDVFLHRPTSRFVVGSSRVLKVSDDPQFANLGYPGTSPETIGKLFRSLPARPVQTVYVGVEAFWFNARYTLAETDLGSRRELEYLLARSTFTHAVNLTHQKHWLLSHRWQRDLVGGLCVLDRFNPAILWRTDGSRVWGWELDPKRFPKFRAAPFTGNLEAWRNGYYADWSRLEPSRIRDLRDALAIARARRWRVVGFAPPEPQHMLRALDGDRRLAPEWRAFLRLMPRVFSAYGFRWVDTVDGAALGCRPSDFPDAFHSDARCSALLLRALGK